MPIKYKENGETKLLNINTNEITVVDLDNNFTKKDLESVIVELTNKIKTLNTKVDNLERNAVVTNEINNKIKKKSAKEKVGV